MSWNRSSEEKVKVKGDGEQRNVHLKGLVAGVIVVLGAVGVWLWLSEPAPVREGADGTVSRRIKETKPAKVSVRTNVTERPLPKALRKQRVGEERNGYRLLPSGELYKVGKVATNRTMAVTLADKIFDQPTDQVIGNLLLVVPGTGFLGDSSQYYQNFDRYFKESLKTKIVINPDDSEEVKELKQAVIDARAEIKARVDAGEDAGQVMREARDQMRELGLYREELEKQVSDIVRGSPTKEFTRKDIQDLIDAANSMLKERGSAPIRMTAAMAYQFHRAKIRQLREEGKKEGETK